ncbi:MAG: hypothetical protein Q8P18_10965 [Pseudomonadota bacterium]|nr:hypothetical protein [Pseudomonadota bacterium]
MLLLWVLACVSSAEVETGLCAVAENRYGTEAVSAALQRWASCHATCLSNADCVLVESPTDQCNNGLPLAATEVADYEVYRDAMVEAIPCSTYVDPGVGCGGATYAARCVDCVCELVEEGPIDTGGGACGG